MFVVQVDGHPWGRSAAVAGTIDRERPSSTRWRPSMALQVPPWVHNRHMDVKEKSFHWIVVERGNVVTNSFCVNYMCEYIDRVLGKMGVHGYVSKQLIPLPLWEHMIDGFELHGKIDEYNIRHSVIVITGHLRFRTKMLSSYAHDHFPYMESIHWNIRLKPWIISVYTGRYVHRRAWILPAWETC